MHRPLYVIGIHNCKGNTTSLLCTFVSSIGKIIFAHLCYPKGVIILARETGLLISVHLVQGYHFPVFVANQHF